MNALLEGHGDVAGHAIALERGDDGLQLGWLDVQRRVFDRDLCCPKRGVLKTRRERMRDRMAEEDQPGDIR
jgi:hypothetical protein